jgi:hypothetical protein
MSYMQAFTEVICGWCWEEDRQTNRQCMMGEILTMYLKYENSNRGGLHAHGQLTQPLLQTQHLLNMLKDGRFQSNISRFLESFMCAYFPIPNMSRVEDDRERRSDDWEKEKCPLSEGDSCNRNVQCMRTSKMVAYVGCTRNVPEEFRWDDTFLQPTPPYDPTRIDKEMFRLVPIEENLPTSTEELQQHVLRTSAYTHGHRHNKTCKKGGRKGDDTECRMGMPRVIVDDTCQIAAGLIAVKQEVGLRVPFVPAMQLACAGNHLISPSCDAARTLRDLVLHRDEMKDASDEKKVSVLLHADHQQN